MPRRVFLSALVLGACATASKTDYVPGGKDLPQDVREEYGDARTAERHGEEREALQRYARLCRDYPTRLAFHLARLRLARDLDGPVAAAALYTPPPRGVGAIRAEILTGLVALPEEDMSGRLSLLEFAVEHEPMEPYWRLAQAEAELRSHDLVAARADRERDLGQVDQARESMKECVTILERAKRACEKAIQLDGEFAGAHDMLGYIATREADVAIDFERRDELRKEAGLHYRKARDLDPGSVSARVNLAENYLYFSEPDRAARELRISAQLAPRQPVIWRNLGLAYYRDGKVGPAADAYRRALELEPLDARTRTALADCLTNEEPEEAISELERARADAADDKALRAEIAFKLAAIHEYAGDYRNAVEQYRLHVQLGGKEAGKAKFRIRTIYASAFDE